MCVPLLAAVAGGADAAERTFLAAVGRRCGSTLGGAADEGEGP